ncbi:uncharacterized protein rab11fip5a isoform X3 [Onychostoma macrolepis]|nr:uncharacterized protein rab11fip5a isoform X3 [Onychostoma macrolepis]
MYDLSMKDKPRSAFDKLRERMRAKKRSIEEDSSSAIVPGGYGALARMRGRLPSDGGGEEDYEDDEGGEARRSKMRSFFLRGRLRKSSDTRSSTSLGSESSESSSRGGSLSPTAGISVVVSDLSNSPSNSSNLTADSPENTVAPSPQVSPVRHVMYDISLPVPHSVTSENDTPILLPSVWVNGNPVETSPLTHHPPSLVLQQPQPESTKPVTQSGQPQATTLPAKPQKTQSTQSKSQETQLPKSQSKPRPEPLLPALGVLQKGSLSLSLQNLSSRGEDKQSGGPVDGRRWSFDKPGEEEKAAIVAALEQAGRVTDEVEMETVIPAGETETQSKKRRGLFSHGKGDSAGKGPIASKEEAERAQPLVEVKHKGWFSSKDSHSKPSPLVSPQSDSSASTICPIVPLTFNDPSQSMADKNANPFTSPPPLFDANPFLPHTQQNPFIHAPLTPDVPSLFSSTHSQSDGNASPDLLRNGNQKGPSQMDISFDPLISHFEGLTEKDDFEHFAKDRLKSEEVNETTNLVTPPSLLMKTNNQEPSGALGGLMVSDTNYPTDLGRTASASTVETSKETAADTPQVSGSDVNYIFSSSNKPDLTAHGAHVFPEFDLSSSEISLAENSSLEFSELNTLACPYPALSPHSKNQDSADDTTLEDHPKTKQNVTQPSVSKADSVELPPSISFEFLEGVSVRPETSQRPEILEFAKDIKSVTVHEDPVPFCGDNSSGDTLEQSTVISDSLGGDLDHQSIEHSLSPQSDIIQSNIIQSNEEFWGSNASPIQNVAVSGKSLVEATEPLVFNVQSGQSSLSTALPVKNGKKMDAVMDTMLQNESGNGILEVVSSKDICSEIEDFVPENLIDGPFFPVLSKSIANDVQEDKQEKVSELPTSPFKNDNLVSQLSTISEEEEIMPSNGPTLPVGHLHSTTGIRTGTEEDASDVNSVLSPGSVLLHSMYKSADSDHYLTCVSQQDFPVSPSLELTQEVKPRHHLSEEDTLKFESLPNHIPNVAQQDDISAKGISEMGCKQDEVIAENINPSPEDLPKQESPLDVLPNNSLLDLLPETHSFAPKSAPSLNTPSENMIKSDFDKPVLLCNPSKDIVEKSNFPKDMSPIVVTSEMIAELEAQLAPLDTDTCMVDESKTCPKDGSFKIETFGIVSEDNLNFVQLTDSNAFVSDCSSEQTSSITQDLVITDSDLKNIFVPQPTEMHLLSTRKGPVANPESAETHNDPEPDPKQTESLDVNTDFWTTPAVQHSVTPNFFPVNWPTLPQPSAPSPFDQPTLASRHDRSLNFTSSLFDLSPVASSTPHIAVDTNALPQPFPFPTVPRTSEVPRPKPAAPLPTMQAVNSTAYNPFLQDKIQTSDHQSSPHPVKPLTPPDEKRSEGRSVLEKLKSTIHSGRTGQDADKKLLVEGGGTYYHLNHSELVNLLIQRDTELRQEREEYERRGALLEKREMELKKMKAVIRDLEDYIDTLLVRIMEQTPTLLQVRSKMK